MKMNNPSSKAGQPLLLKMLKSLFSRLTRPGEDYPVKYYKRDRSFMRART